MNDDELTPISVSVARWQARLKMSGIVVLALGLATAAIVYWTGTSPPDYSDDPSTAHAYKVDSRNLEINFGKMGAVANDLSSDLQRPGAQALLIAGAAVFVAGGCFYFARLMEHAAEGDDSTP